MFRRRNMGGRSFGRTNPTFGTTSCKDQEDWTPIEHFLYTYMHFIDYEEQVTEDASMKIVSAVASWFPEEVLIDSTINIDTVTETITNYRINYDGDKDIIFNKSLTFTKDWFENDPGKMEIMLDEIWELIAIDNKLSDREKQLFLTISKSFNIKVDLE
tara:strand:+ start:1867 stop:2340 length:474 start_codon:yes stop_codon:yes gene_type:complete